MGLFFIFTFCPPPPGALWVVTNKSTQAWLDLEKPDQWFFGMFCFWRHSSGVFSAWSTALYPAVMAEGKSCIFLDKRLCQVAAGFAMI